MGRVDVPVLKGVTLEVRRGEWVAVLGASGCGKSTLLHLLGDLDRPDADSGEVQYLGRELSAMSLHERNVYRNQIVGFVFQFYHLLPELNVMENAMLHALVKPSLRRPGYWLSIALGGALVGAVIAGFSSPLWLPPGTETYWLLAIAIAVGAILSSVLSLAIVTETRSLLHRFSAERRQIALRAKSILESFGLGHRLNHRPRELSGGERQRVAIARALMNQPAVLLADEPTGNLDERTGGEILDLIAEQHRNGLTIVMVTHDPTIAARADRIVRLHDGQVDESHH